MSEETRGHLFGPTEYTNPGFKATLEYIRKFAKTQHKKSDLFERLMLKYFSEDPDYKEQFSKVWLWKQWAQLRTDFDATDIGIDLVAEKHDGSFCAIQCKCYAEDTRISKLHIDTFLSASAGDIFTSWIFVNTGGEFGDNAIRTIEPLGEKFRTVRFNDLENSPFDWPDLSIQEPETLTYKQRKYDLKDHQKDAFNDVINGFKTSDRGKLIMACGTGKTFTALRIAEEIAGIEGKVLYLVPSIGLLSQSMREWSDQRGIDHSYIGICSDRRAGDTTEDASIQELKIPVTTDPLAITQALQKADTNKMTVVFCTYQSLPLIEKAQDAGAPQFDIILCDEAHRTTGIDKPGDKTSPFILVHDPERIRANKRLYMTATPKLYTENARTKAAEYNVDVFSMDDEEKYGPQFHILPFSKAVEIGELSDYKVAIFGISEQEVNSVLAGDTGRYGSEININDATRIIGCWRALQNPEDKEKDDQTRKPLRRVIAFTNRIDESKALAHYWNDIIDDAIVQLPEDEIPDDFECETRHVDGTVHALNRKTRIDWLKGGTDGVCRILSNARCLSEGIDVPALDAVIFYKPRKSHIDVVQAVGRVMRKATGKQFGYVILPVTIPDDKDPAAALDDNERFSNVWSVLNALRSHDDRLDAKINSIDLNQELPDPIVIGGRGNGAAAHGLDAAQLPLLPIEIPIEAIIPKIVEKCGDKRYWENWAKDVAEIFDRLIDRINNLLENPENTALTKKFENFHTELQETINDSITRTNAIDMIAQHILTRPVFDALFENYDFSSGNPVAIALNSLQNDFAEFGLESETRDLKGFYESVQKRASGIKTSEDKQRVLSDLYEQFFKKALKKEADRLGIAYTPIELVDFIVHSVNDVLQEEFGKTLSDEGVHILDPFTGTGTFLVQLLQSGLIQPEDLERKYHKELHANEILLLAYYIASVNIEETYRGQRGGDSDYEPFEGIILTDTFNLNKFKEAEQYTLLPDEQRMIENNKRIERQQNLPIEVIIGNPPWSAKQKSSADDNRNVEYPELENRISETYAEHTTATLKNSLYDTYKMAIRWATDRLYEETKEQGIVAFVTPATWITGNVDAGIRGCLAEEINSIYVLNLKGNAKIYGEQGKLEGEGVFGSTTQSPVAITILVKNPNVTHERCHIHYREIGNTLKRKEKLNSLSEAKSMSGFPDWEIINPNKHYDWIEQRNGAFTEFYPMGSKETKAGKLDNAVFVLYSRGLATSRDKYVYNFSRDACTENALRMTQDYLNALSELEENPDLDVREVAHQHTANVQWDRELENNLRRKKTTKFDVHYIRKAAYRPYMKANCYADYTFTNCKYQQDQIFPDSSSENRVICVPGISSKKSFSALMTDIIPDLNINDAGTQCFPRWRYPKSANAHQITSGIEPERIDNISDTALHAFQEHYDDDTITKDDIFDYVYGILHAPSYREQFANDLSKMLPHIPYAPDFRAFAAGGKALAALHLNYENCKQYPGLKVKPIKTQLFWEEKPEHLLLGTKPMKWKNKTTKDILIINEHVLLTGIPEEAHHYVVNGRTPLEWFINRYKITPPEKNNGILNDANAWFDTPRDLITAIERIVYVSVESARIIDNLPTEITEE